MTQSKAFHSRMWSWTMDMLRAGGRWFIALFGTAVVTVLLLFLAGVFTEKVHGPESARSRDVPIGAQVVTVRSMTRPRYESAVGSIEPIHESSVASKILARVLEVNVSAGQLVHEGEVLVRLDDENLQARLRQVEAQRDAAAARVEQAAADLARAQQLIEARAISKAELESAVTAEKTSKAELERAEQAVEEANALLAYCTIEAPFDGVVVEKSVQFGDTVIPGQTLLALYDPNQMQLVANVRESLAMGLTVGQQLPAKLEALDLECMATVREVVPQADIGSRSFQVKVSGPCPSGIYSGMFGRLMLPLEDETITLIPADAIRHVGQLTLVDVVEDGQVLTRNVQIGRMLGPDIEILAGLAVGENVLRLSGGEATR